MRERIALFRRDSIQLRGRRGVARHLDAFVQRERLFQHRDAIQRRRRSRAGGAWFGSEPEGNADAGRTREQNKAKAPKDVAGEFEDIMGGNGGGEHTRETRRG